MVPNDVENLVMFFYFIFLRNFFVRLLKNFRKSKKIARYSIFIAAQPGVGRVQLLYSKKHHAPVRQSLRPMLMERGKVWGDII